MDGFGVYVCAEYTYQGNYLLGERDGFGVMLYIDGTMYEGQFRKNLKFGEGQLVLPNGDKLIGIWNGENVQGLYRKGVVGVAPRCSTLLIKEKIDKIPEHSLSFAQIQSSELCSNWSALFRGFSKMKEVQDKCAVVVKEVKHTLSINVGDARELLQFLLEKLLINDLSSLVETFVDIFNWKYAKGEILKTDRPQALDDLFSFIETLYFTILNLLTHELADLMGRNKLRSHVKQFIVKKVYKRLFGIYTAIFKDRDASIKYKMLGLQYSSPKDFGVSDSLIPQDEPYLKCIQILEKIGSYNSSIEKFDCLMDVAREVVRTIESIENRDASRKLGSDDLFPIHLYILAKSKIPHVWSLLQFLHDFTDELVIGSERYYRVTVFELTIEFIDNLESNLRDSLGVLIPVSLFENELETCVNQIYKNTRKSGKQAPYLSWICTLFIEIGSMHGLKINVAMHPESLDWCTGELVEVALEILKIGGLDLIIKQEEFDVQCTVVYPSNVYFKLASRLEKILDEISI